MFENLSDRLERSFKVLKGEGKITEINIAETVKEIRRALLDADVSYMVAKDFCDRVKKKAIGSNVLTAVKPQQMMVKIVHDELADFMGSEQVEINIKGSPAVVLVAGLNGSGKTTFSGKLALHLKGRKGKKVLLAACDTFRPAAIEQLKTLGGQVGVPVYSEEGEKDPVKVAKGAVAKARTEGYNVVVVDTAGRLVVDKELMDEISLLHSSLNPDETLFEEDVRDPQADGFGDAQPAPVEHFQDGPVAEARGAPGIDALEDGGDFFDRQDGREVAAQFRRLDAVAGILFPFAFEDGPFEEGAERAHEPGLGTLGQAGRLHVGEIGEDVLPVDAGEVGVGHCPEERRYIRRVGCHRIG